MALALPGVGNLLQPQHIFYSYQSYFCCLLKSVVTLKVLATDGRAGSGESVATILFLVVAMLSAAVAVQAMQVVAMVVH